MPDKVIQDCQFNGHGGRRKITKARSGTGSDRWRNGHVSRQRQTTPVETRSLPSHYRTERGSAGCESQLQKRAGRILPNTEVECGIRRYRARFCYAPGQHGARLDVTILELECRGFVHFKSNSVGEKKTEYRASHNAGQVSAQDRQAEVSNEKVHQR